MADQRRKPNPRKPQAEAPRQPGWRRVQQETRSPARRPAPKARATKDAQPRVPLGVVLRRAVVPLGVLALLAGAIWLLWSGNLTVSAAQVAIEGNQRVPVETIYAASQVDGKFIFQVRPGQVAAQLARTPGIASADVSLWPPASVTIRVHEYTPLLAWQGITETVWLSADGTPVPALGDPPQISLVDAQGAARTADGRLRPQALAYLTALQAARPSQTHLYYGLLEGLYFRATQGWTIYLGQEGPIAQKLALLEGIERDAAAKGRRLEVIDLRSADHAQIR